MTVARLVTSIGDRIREAVILCRIFWDSSFDKNKPE